MAKVKAPYLKLRNGRPRWEPGPHLRARGFHGQDLKNDTGEWLSPGAAADAANALNAAAGASKAASKEKTVIIGAGPRTVSKLIDLYKMARKLNERSDRAAEDAIAAKVGKRKTKLGDKTKAGYLRHLKLIEDWSGDIPAAGVTRDSIRTFHAELDEAHGLSEANAVMRTLSSLLNYAVDDLEWLVKNRAAKLRLDQPEGRLVLWEPAELFAFQAVADALDVPSQGDALLFGALTGQRQADVIGLPETARNAGSYVIKTRKRGKLVNIREIAALKRRIDDARSRKKTRWPNVYHTAEFVCERTGTVYDPDDFRKTFRVLRAIAAGRADEFNTAGLSLYHQELLKKELPASNLYPCPSILTKRWQDLRDTAVTMLFASGCDIAEICTYTGHSLKTAQDILDKHYFVRLDAMAEAASKKFEAYLTTAGFR